MNAVTTPTVLISTRPCNNGTQLGVLTLNRPAALNALTLEMCATMLAQLRAWQNDASIAAVVIRAEGDKAFCAGGDVAEVVRQVKAGGQTRFNYGDEFFSVEYALDLLIHAYPKPIIALAQGITMGGGVGLMVGASHRVVSTGARIAMPEIHIGLFPDVGGGYFLNRVPCRAGWLMALTGLLINEHDAVLGSLADTILPAPAFQSLIATLAGSQKMLTHDAVTALINAMPERVMPDAVNAPLWQRMPAIHALMHVPNVTQVRDGLIALAAKDAWFESPAKNLAHGSPTTAHVAWEYLRRSFSLGIEQVLAMDLVLAKQFPRHVDFLEGVRAVLIDKDKKPTWNPATFDEVSSTLVNQHFSPL